jgi:hypothetical protein
MNTATMIPNYGGDGKFEYVNDEHERLMLQNAFAAISATNLWDFVAKDRESFMFSREQGINTISAKMEELGYSGHSGATFGWTLRAMQYLVNNGEEKFKETYYEN